MEFDTNQFTVEFHHKAFTSTQASCQTSSLEKILVLCLHKYDPIIGVWVWGDGDGGGSVQEKNCHSPIQREFQSYRCKRKTFRRSRKRSFQLVLHGAVVVGEYRLKYENSHQKIYEMSTQKKKKAVYSAKLTPSTTVTNISSNLWPEWLHNRQHRRHLFLHWKWYELKRGPHHHTSRWHNQGI